MSTTGPIIGMVISIVVVLGLTVSLYWAVTEEEDEMRDSTTPKYIYVETNTTETVTSRIAQPQLVNPARVSSWGTIPGDFASSYQTLLTINNYDESFLSKTNIKKMLSRVEAGEDKKAVVDAHLKNYQGVPYSASTQRTVDTILGSQSADFIEYQQISAYLASIDETMVATTVNYDGLNLWW